MARTRGPQTCAVPSIAMEDHDDLRKFISDLAVVHGRVVLSSGREADWYVDLRRVTLHNRAAPLVGRVMRELTADWSYDAVGGLTLGADPIAFAMLHAAGRPLDAFVVRKAGKAHGLQRRIEGPDVAGRRCWRWRTPPHRGKCADRRRGPSRGRGRGRGGGGYR